MCDRQKGKNGLAGDDSFVSCESWGVAWFGRVSTERKKVEFVRKEHRALAWEGWSAFPPISPHNNHSGEVAAKATALKEETVTSCDAAAYTWHSSIYWIIAFNMVIWPGHSSFDILYSSLVYIFWAWSKSLSIIWHPFTLALRHHHETVSSIV